MFSPVLQSGNAWDRLIDWGSGAKADNLVNAFQYALRYEVYQGASNDGVHVTSPAFPVSTWTHVGVVQTRIGDTDFGSGRHRGGGSH